MTGTQEGRRVAKVPLFLNGEGMRGGRVHPHVARYPFLGEARTAPRYRFYVYQDRFPALWPVHDGGVSVPGELIELPLEAVRDEFLFRVEVTEVVHTRVGRPADHLVIEVVPKALTLCVPSAKGTTP